MKKRLLAIGRRWADVLVVSITAASLVSLLPGELVGRCGEKGWLDGYRQLVLLPLVLVLLVRRGWRQSVAAIGLRHPLSYPSPFMAGLFGSAMAMAGIGLSELLRSHWGCTEIEPAFALKWAGLLAAGVIVAAVLVAALQFGAVAIWQRWTRLRSKEPSPQPASTEDLFEWIQSDAPIQAIGEDRFGTKQLVQQLGERLQESTEPLAVVGEIGAGKTSLMYLVRGQLKKWSTRSPAVIVPVSVWPYTSAEAAVTGILSALTQALGAHVSTWPISGLPAEYLELIEHIEGWPARFARIFRVREAEPRTALEHYDQTARAIGVRLLLWLEDLERFAGDTARDLPAHDDGPIRLQPIQSLIALLAGFEAIGIVLSVGTWASRFDIEKVVRRVERLPRLNEDSIGPIIREFANRCVLSTKAFLSEREPLKSLEGTTDELRMIKAQFLNAEPSLLGALATLCSNPRKLKFALRHTLDVWRSREGEIDLIDVLSMSTIRASEPGLFGQIETHIDLLRGSPSSTHGTTEKKQPNPIQTLLNRLEGHGEERRTAVERLLLHVFDQWANKQGASSRPPGLQRLRIWRRGRDYWQRYMSTAPLPEDEKDQTILLAISTLLNGGPPEQLLNAFSTSKQQPTAEQFCSAILTNDQVLTLFRPAVQHALTEKPPFQDSDPAVLDSMRRLLKEKPVAEAQLQDAISKALRDAVRLSLRVASSLMNQFVVPGESLLRANVLDVVRNDFWADLRATFAGEQGIRQLVAASTGAPIYALIWCSWGLDRIRTGNFNNLPFDGWGEFATIAVAAAELDPGTMLLQLVPLLVDRHDHFPLQQKTTYSFNRERSERLFDMDRLARVIRTAPEPADATIREMLRAVRRDLG